jgi:mono/diheme cytochrome c family protein
MKKAALLFLVVAAITAGVVEAREASMLPRAAQRGLAFAEQRCAACHAVRPNATSPNPDAPPWEDIANRPGVSRATMRAFLRDSHNFPDAMNFRVDARRIRDLADYMLTMRREGYKPVM